MASLLDRAPAVIDFDDDEWKAKDAEIVGRFTAAVRAIPSPPEESIEETNRKIAIANAIGLEGNAHIELFNEQLRRLKAWRDLIDTLTFERPSVTRQELYALLDIASSLSACRNRRLVTLGAELTGAVSTQLKQLDRQASARWVPPSSRDRCPACHGVGGTTMWYTGETIVCPLCAGTGDA